MGMKECVLVVVACFLLLGCVQQGGVGTGQGPNLSGGLPEVKNIIPLNMCGDGTCDRIENSSGMCPQDCEAENLGADSANQTIDGKNATLYLGFMVHLEGWDDTGSNASFQRHTEAVRNYADVFEKHGAKLTLESKEYTDGCIKWNENVLKEMENRGHGIGVHADAGVGTNYTYVTFLDELKAGKAELETLGVEVRHVSGICSKLDWVSAARDSGYKFVTGQVAYCVSSMPPGVRPAEYRDCPSPAACHQVFPGELANRTYPWRMENGVDWLTDDAQNGKVVMLPASGGLSCMWEEKSGNRSGQKCEFTKEDINASIEELEQAIALSEEGRVNTYYLSNSLGSELNSTLLDEWLARIDPYVRSGKVEWKTLPGMYDAYMESK
ncbi:MAG: hypothetical protein WC488_01140 [Candidatus Micrarchaeia archaeon]